MSGLPPVLTLPSPRVADTHWAFRGTFSIEGEGTATLRVCGANWFEATLDGEFLIEGPVRFDQRLPEFEEREIVLSAGRHVLAVHLHDMFLHTRIVQKEIPGFLWLEIWRHGRKVPVEWRRLPLTGFMATGRRVGCVLGWVEWCDTRLNPAGWQKPEFPDGDWPLAPQGTVEIGPFREASIGPMEYADRLLTPAGVGDFVAMSPFDHDPPMSFVLRELEAKEFGGLPPNGKWKRFDLGRVMLGRPKITLDVPAGTLVQVAYAESLSHGRVFPYIKSGSGDDSCPMDTWFARGGRQTFCPLHPKGARFLEIHVPGDPAKIRWIREQFVERSYFCREPEGTFSCSDPLLNRIWQVGVDTLRSCCEDALTDNPTRERGQWLGDTAGPGMDILAVAYEDQRLVRRCLVQAAECAAPSGMIPAVFPGTRRALPTFSIQWVTAVLHYFQGTGDRTLLKELFPAAVANLKVFEQDREPGGLKRNPAYWNFLDWGTEGATSVFNGGEREEAKLDPALSLFYLASLRALAQWAIEIGLREEAQAWAGKAQTLGEEITRILGSPFRAEIGFHAATLALREHIFSAHDAVAAVSYLKEHLLSCFPNDLSAPRLEEMRVLSPRIITPFFMNYALPVLMEYGEVDFVLDQFRTCWGWMLDQGVTTWYEVFDPRWSHCHQWSGCPTWMLTRSVLGWQPRLDRGSGHYDFRPQPGSLEWATGTIPDVSGPVSVSWRKRGAAEIECQLTVTAPLNVSIAGRPPLRIEKTWEGVLSVDSKAA